MPNMPKINIDSVVDKVLQVDDAAEEIHDINLAILIDESVSPEFITYARDAFSPKNEYVHLHVESFYNEPADVDENTDLAIVIANGSPWTGATAAIAKSKNVQVVVVAEHLDIVISRSEATEFELDHDNLIAAEIISDEYLPFLKAVKETGSAVTGAVNGCVDLLGRQIPMKFFGKELVSQTFDFDLPDPNKEVDYDDVFDALAKWVIKNCPSCSATFTDAFEFARPAQVKSVAFRTANENAVTAAIFFLPGADLPVMTLNQIKMLIQIERAYDYSLDRQTLIEVAAVVGSGFASRTVARWLCRKAPVFGWLIKVGLGYVVTLILGHFINLYAKDGRKLPMPIELPFVKKEQPEGYEPTGNAVVVDIEE